MQHVHASAEMQGTVLAHATDAKDVHLFSAAHLYDALPLPFIHIVPPEQLRLHPVVWHRISEYLSGDANLTRTQAVHLALYFWRHAEAHTETRVKSIVWARAVSKRPNAPRQNVRLDIFFAVHSLLCGNDCAIGSDCDVCKPCFLPDACCVLIDIQVRRVRCGSIAASSASRLGVSCECRQGAQSRHNRGVPYRTSSQGIEVPAPCFRGTLNEPI